MLEQRISAWKKVFLIILQIWYFTCIFMYVHIYVSFVYKSSSFYHVFLGRTVFLIIHLITPITIAALNSISNGERDLHYLVNICWSQSMSMHEIGNSSVLDDPGGMDMFCTNRHYQTTYYLGAAASHYMDPFLRMICGSISIFQAIFCSNLCELFVYALLYKYLNR